MNTLKSLARNGFLLALLAVAVCAQSYTIQGPNGPVPAKRPDALSLELLHSDDIALAERFTLAAAFAAAGYTIDAPVDVFGWDYTKTMNLRRSYGYKWVPAVGMAPVVIAPGLSVPGIPSYDFDNAPEGAILVPSIDGSTLSKAARKPPRKARTLWLTR